MNQQLVDRVLQSPRIPSLPAIALELISLAQRHDVDFKRIVRVIQHDPALSSKILKTVNSPFYGQPRAVSTISRALQVLGLNSVKTLALGFSLVGNLKQTGEQGFDHVSYWRRSLFTATAARILSRRAGLVQQEEAFLGGLLQDVGMVSLSQVLGPEYTTVLEQAGSCHASLTGFEAEALGTHHAEVGAFLAEAWELPPLLVGLIRHHEDPSGATDDLRTITRCVALGNRVAEVFLTDDGDAAALATYDEQVDHWFGIGREDAESLLREIHDRTKDMGQLFELPTGNMGNPDEILARANEALTQLTLQSQQENRRLIADVHTDAMTGALNRRAFDQFIGEAFGQATSDHPLSLLFVDIDHFKRFNDTYGHALGDQILIAFAGALRDSVQDRGKVFRCGGEEFGIVCSRTSTAAAAVIADGARQAVERMQVSAENGVPLSITCSIGLATHAGGTYTDVSSLLKAADECLYDAKAAGRNCVRVSSARQTPDAA